MKKIISTLAFLMVAAFSFGQTLSVPGETEALSTSKKTGAYKFVISGIPLANIQSQHATYTRYFTVKEAEGKDGVTVGIKMVTNDANSRRIIHRYLVSVGVTKVMLGGTEMTVDAFMEKYVI